jgi:hypothetical protein
MFPRSQTLVFSTIIVLTRLIISRRIDSVACQTFWYIAQRFGGLSMIGSVGPHNIGKCPGPTPPALSPVEEIVRLAELHAIRPKTEIWAHHPPLKRMSKSQHGVKNT